MVQSKFANENSSNIKYVDRGMTIAEVNTLLTAPMGNKERAFFRAIYETFYRASELLLCDIEDYNRQTGELVARHTKKKFSPKTRKIIISPPKHMVLSETTQLLFKKIIGNRKKGAIFVNRKGKRCSIFYFQQYLDNLALSLGIQQVTHITPRDKKYHLVTLQGLRESGERHTDLSGADSDITARGSQHSKLVKEKYYKKSGWEEIQNQVKMYHPAFNNMKGVK